MSMIGRINNMEELTEEFLRSGAGHFEALSGGTVNSIELVAALIDQKDSFAEGIRYAQSRVDGTVNLLIATQDGTLIAARDKRGRLPVLLERARRATAFHWSPLPTANWAMRTAVPRRRGMCQNHAHGGGTAQPAPAAEEKFCAFLWTYFGYPNSHYEGDSVEVIRNRGGAVMARNEQQAGTLPELDAVCGVPDSGIPYAVGYANQSGVPFARPFIKYTPLGPAVSCRTTTNCAIRLPR
jgi:amidophosphoribosyltransferase